MTHQIKKLQRSAVVEAFNMLANRASHNPIYLKMADVRSAVMAPDEIDLLDRAAAICQDYYGSPDPFEINVAIPDPTHQVEIAGKVLVTISGETKLWARNLGFRHGDRDFVKMVMDRIVDDISTRFAAATAKQTYTRMVDMSRTHEDVAFYFPGHVAVMKAADIDWGIAAEVEAYKRPASLPIGADLRRELRSLNMWFATQELLGAFEPRASSGRQEGEACLVLQVPGYFKGNTEDGEQIVRKL